MEIKLPEIVDRITISQLKIERLKEPYLKKELEAYEDALKKFENVQIKQEWFSRLKEINTKIWDLESEVRNVMGSEDIWKAAEEQFGFEELGRRIKIISKLVVDRANLKNKITEETGHGFKEIKTNYCGQKTSP